MIDLASWVEGIEIAAKATFMELGDVLPMLHMRLDNGAEAMGDLGDMLSDDCPLLINFASAGMQFASCFPDLGKSYRLDCVALLSMGIVCNKGDDIEQGHKVIAILAADLSEKPDNPDTLCVSYDVIRQGQHPDLANRLVTEEKSIELKNSPAIHAFLEGMKLYLSLVADQNIL